MRYLTLGLLLLSLVSAGCSSEAPSPPTRRPAQRPGRSTAAAPTRSSPAGQPVNLGPARYNPKDRRDPFYPLVEPPREEKALDIGGYKLSGIVWQKDHYFALLETPDGLGHILRVNDRLGPDARVKAITKEAVLIEMKDKNAARKGQVRTIRLELQQKKKEGK
ncbi:MAG: hypothetical protein ACE5IQ_01875 [Candidatus Methylomirabilales bacterium]